jgi:hypothetical protein
VEDQVTKRSKLTVAVLAIAVVAVVLYANVSVTRRAEAELADYVKDRYPLDINSFMVLEMYDGPNLKSVLLDRASGVLIDLPFVLRDHDGGILAVRENKSLVRLSGSLLQNLRIWIFGPSRPTASAKAVIP